MAGEGGMGMSGGTSIAGWISQIAGDIVGANANRMIKEIMDNLPKIKPIDISDSALKALKINKDLLPGAQSLAAGVNAFQDSEFAKSMERALPGFSQIRSQIDAIFKDRLSGNMGSLLEADRNFVQNRSAARSVAGGFAGSGADRALKARDFGLTEYQQTSDTINQYQTWMKVNERPLFDFTNMFVSTGAVNAADVQQSQLQYESDMTALLGKTYPGATGYWANTAKMRGDQLSGSSGGNYNTGTQQTPQSYRGMSASYAQDGPGADTNWWSEPRYLPADNSSGDVNVYSESGGGSDDSGIWDWFKKYE